MSLDSLFRNGDSSAKAALAGSQSDRIGFRYFGQGWPQKVVQLYLDCMDGIAIDFLVLFAGPSGVNILDDSYVFFQSRYPLF